MTADKWELRINADDLARLEKALDIAGLRETIEEKQGQIIAQGKVIADQERIIRELRQQVILSSQYYHWKSSQCKYYPCDGEDGEE